MKASELIAKLQDMIDRHGDLEVVGERENAWSKVEVVSKPQEVWDRWFYDKTAIVLDVNDSF